MKRIPMQRAAGAGAVAARIPAMASGAPTGIFAAAAALVLGGCNLAPHYEPPNAPTSPAFKEAVAGGDAESRGWKQAQPQDGPIRDQWWEAYGDPQLDELEKRVEISNQNILAAEANYRAAYALVQEAEAQLFPTLSLVPAATREKSSAALAGIGGVSTTAGTTTATGSTGPGSTAPTAPAPGSTVGAGTGTSTTAAAPQGNAPGTHNIFSLPLQVSYQIDLWGSVRNTVAENRFSAQASAAQLANALLSTQSSLAQDYFQLRVADEQRRILETTVADYRASLHLVHTLLDSGMNSEADVATAQSQLESALASATDAGVARAQYEHAIAVLIGAPPSQFSIPYRHFKQPLPVIPVGLPSDLLERRPDIAAAERQVAEQNEQIGIAISAYYPTVTLCASGGYESTALSNLFSLPNRFWSIGPSLAQTLFDGGARRAAVAQARALNDSQAAAYRQTVLNAFQSVEDNLAALQILSAELGQAHGATVAAKRAVELTVVLFRNGVDSYVNVITAQNAFLTARETELSVQLRQLTASVNLINDLGGGWRTSEPDRMERLAQHPPDAAKRPLIPEENGVPALPNPPPLPREEIQPDELIEQNQEATGP